MALNKRKNLNKTKSYIDYKTTIKCEKIMKLVEICIHITLHNCIGLQYCNDTNYRLIYKKIYKNYFS